MNIALNDYHDGISPFKKAIEHPSISIKSLIESISNSRPVARIARTGQALKQWLEQKSQQVRSTVEEAIRQLLASGPTVVGAALLAVALWCASLGMIASGVASIRSEAAQRSAPRLDSVFNLATLPIVYTDSAADCAGTAQQITTVAFNELARQLGEAHPPQLALWAEAPVVAQGNLLTTLESSAVQRAQELAVDVVVYGVLECSSQSLSISLFLYVAPTALGIESNLAGAYPLHTWLQSKEALNSAEVRQAMEAVAYLVRGLRYSKTGSYDDALNAVSAFEGALRNNTVTDLRLRAVLSHLIGNAYIRAAHQSCALSAQHAFLQMAEGYYLRAIDNAPALANAHLALGRLYNELVPVGADSREVDRWLARGETHFLRALDARPQEDTLGIEMRVGLGRAHARLIEHRTRGVPGEQSPSLAVADLLLQSALGQYRTLPESSREALRDEAARGYLVLSEVNKARGWRQGAIDALWLAESLALDTEIRASAASALAELLAADGDLCVAAAKALAATQTRCEAQRLSFAERAQTLHMQCRLKQDQIQR